MAKKKDFSSFLPEDLALLKTGQQIQEGTLLFADISGFTALSEVLAKEGKQGIEELTHILNRYFDAMLQSIRTFKGDVLKFAGDSILARFKGSEGGTCAQKMMEEISRFEKLDTTAGQCSLSMKIVTVQGKWNEFILGDSRRAELFLSGSVIQELRKAEAKAQPGEILVRGTKDNGHKLQKQESKQIPAEALLPEGVLDIVERGMFGEYRPTTCMFIRIEGYNESEPDFILLQQIFKDIIDFAEYHSGSIQMIDNLTEHGSKVLVLFGAPFSSGNDVSNGVFAGKKLCDTISQYCAPVKVAVGLNAGYVYAGIIGNRWRKTYTVMGDAVNTSARLADTADSEQVVVSKDVFRLTGTLMEYKQLKGAVVKGKEKSLERYLSIGMRVEDVPRYRFVGRKNELQAIIGAVKSGNSVIEVRGDAGIGKTRLIGEAVQNLKDEGFAILTGATDQLKSAYFIFASMIAREASISDADTPSARKEKLEQLVSGLQVTAERQTAKKELVKRIDIIGTMLFGLHYPDSLYEQLSPELRKQNLFDALRYFMLCQPDLLCVAVDDLHWCKDEDLEALEYLTRKLFLFDKKIMNLLLSSRPTKKAFKFDKEIRKITMDLKGLDESSMGAFSSQILEGKPLEQKIDDIVRKKAEGNPFYVEQFLYYLKEKGLITESEGEWKGSATFRAEALPESVFAMILSRIDRLEEQVKESLRVASVMGMEFKESMIEAIMNKSVHSLLEVSLGEQLTYLKDMRELEYIFSHTMIRDVIYESILQQRRKQIHLSVATIIEENNKDAPDKVVELLAYHFGQAEDWEKEKRYVMGSATKASDSFRNEEAIHYYLRAIELLEKQFTDDRENLATMHNGLSMVYLRTGRFTDSFNHLERMSEANPGDIVTQMSSLRTRSAVSHIMGKFDTAFDLVKKAEALIPAEGDVEVVVEHALILVEKCRILQMKGEVELSEKSGIEAIRMLEELLKENKEAPMKAKSSLALGITVLCGVYYHTGKFEEGIERYKEAIELYEEMNQKMGLGTANIHLGLFYHALGKLEDSEEHYRIAIDIWKHIGDAHNEAIASGNLGLVYYDRCEYEKAIDCFTKHLNVSRESGDRWGISIANGNLGMVHSNLGDFDKAISFYEEHRRLSIELGYRRGEAMACGNFAQVYREQRKYDDAKGELERHLEISEEIDDQLGKGIAFCELGGTYIQLGHYVKAEGHLSKAKDLLEETGNKSSLIALYNNLSELHLKHKRSPGTAKEFADKAMELSEELENKTGIAQSLIRLARIESMEENKRAGERYKKAMDILEGLGLKKKLADVWQEYGELLKSEGKEEYREFLKRAKKAHKEMGIPLEHD